MDGDDADGRARRVRDDDGLRLVSGKSRSVVDRRGGRRHRPAGEEDAPSHSYYRKGSRHLFEWLSMLFIASTCLTKPFILM